MRASSRTWILLAISLLGVALRIYCAIKLNLSPEFDFKRYYEAALSFADGRGLSLAGAPFIAQPPLYSGLLGVWFHFFGGDVWSAKLLNLAVSGGTLLVWAWLVAKARFPTWAQIASLFILAVHPAIVCYVVVLGTETLSVFLCVLLLAFSLLENRSRWLLLGIVCGLLALNRPQMLIVPLLVSVSAVLAAAAHGKFSRGSLALLGATALVIAPWTARNWATFNAFVPVSANSGYVLMVNNNSSNNSGAWMPLSEAPLGDADIEEFKKVAGLDRTFFRGSDEGAKFRQWSPQADTVAREIGSRWIMEHPKDFMKLAWLRVRLTFDGVSLMMWPFHQAGGAPRALVWVVQCVDLGLLIISGSAFIIGLFVGIEPILRVAWICGIAVVVSTFAGVLIFEGQGRYMLPMVPAQLFIVLSFWKGMPSDRFAPDRLSRMQYLPSRRIISLRTRAARMLSPNQSRSPILHSPCMRASR